MKLKEIFKKTSWKEVEKKLIEIYPYEKNFLSYYKDVFKTFKTINPVSSNMKIYLDSNNSLEEILVYGQNGKNLLEEWEESGRTYSKPKKANQKKKVNYDLSFHPWKELLDMEVILTKKIENSEIIAYCLKEFTVFGFNEKHIQKENRKIKKLLSERLKTFKE